MKAAISSGAGHYELEDVELLPLEPTDVRVRTTVAMGCVTDVHARRHGKSPGLEEPHIRGHAGVGIIEEVGSAVTHTVPGDRVLVVCRPQCGECFWCVNDQPTHCVLTQSYRPAAQRANGDMIGASARVGSYAEQMRVIGSAAIPIVSTLTDEELVPLTCPATTGYGAVFNTAKVKPGQTIAVVGAGGVGLTIAQAAQVSQAANIVVVEPFAPRRELALQMGATFAVATEAEADAILKDLTDGRGADIAFEAAGFPEALNSAFRLARQGGDIVGIGFGAWNAEVTFPFNLLTLKGKRILASQFGDGHLATDLPKYVKLIEEGTLDVGPLIADRYTLDDINLALDEIETQKTLGAIVVP